MGLKLPDSAEVQDDGLWAEHLPAWEAFCAISGQWRVASLSTMDRAKAVYLSLDYAAAKAGLDLAGIEPSPEVWADLRVIERGASEELNRG